MRPMTENQPSGFDSELATLLTGMASTFKNDRHQTKVFQQMEASENIGQVIRHLHSAAGAAVMDAYDVLTGKFGLDGSHELYNYLFTVPYRWKSYEEAYRAETYVGCVDRTITRIAHEVSAAGGQETAPPRRDPRFQIAAQAKDSTGSEIGEAAAMDALILADQFDDARRIQRISSDTRTIASRIVDAGAAPGVTDEQARGLVRLVLATAADIAREQDGLEL
jgi:hypothetical protein